MRSQRKQALKMTFAFVVFNFFYFFVLTRRETVERNISLSHDSRYPARKLKIDNEQAKEKELIITPLMKLKLEGIKADINDTKLLNKDKFPGNMLKGYIVSNPTICNTGTSHVIDLVILVHTAPQNFEKRKRIRESFANKDSFLPFQVRVVFLLGVTRDKDLASQVLFENKKYRDSVIGDFVDDYHNLTLKGVMGFRWVSEHCSHARFVLKIDDDVLVNTYKILYSLTKHLRGEVKSVLCDVRVKHTQPIRREGEGRVDSHIFSKYNTFPYNFCSGFFVLFTGDMMAPLYHVSKLSPYFWVDEVYLFGMLPYLVGDVTFHEHKLQRSSNVLHLNYQNCTQKLGNFLATTVPDTDFWPLWNQVRDIYEFTEWKVRERFVP